MRDHVELALIALVTVCTLACFTILSLVGASGTQALETGFQTLIGGLLGGWTTAKLLK